MNDDKKYCVYVHVNKQNGKRYVGRTGNIDNRWKPSAYKGCKYFYNAIQKYGWDGFDHIILKDYLTYQQSIDLENRYIEMFNTRNPNNGYNLTGGNEYPNYCEDYSFPIKSLQHPLGQITCFDITSLSLDFKILRELYAQLSPNNVEIFIMLLINFGTEIHNFIYDIKNHCFPDFNQMVEVINNEGIEIDLQTFIDTFYLFIQKDLIRYSGFAFKLVNSSKTIPIFIINPYVYTPPSYDEYVDIFGGSIWMKFNREIPYYDEDFDNYYT